VSERTLARWRSCDDFKGRFRAAQREVVNDSIRLLQSATGEAVKTLRRNLANESGFVSNAAANSILSHSLKAIELEELAERIERLETMLSQKGSSKQ
jgi:hypothetical protein